MINSLRRIAGIFLDFFVSPSGKKYRWGNLAVITLLFVAGLFQWCRFLNWGRGPYTFHDWADITAPRLAFLQDAMQKGNLPLHMASPDALGGVTRRFMAVPDVILSPQIIFLRWLDMSGFIVFQLGLMYTLGFWGLLHLRRKFGLSILAFTTIFLLYNFNGHLLAHFSVGHFSWGGSFLFIWFTLLVIELIEGHAGWGWVAKFSILMLFILLQGSYHQFVWGIFFLVCLGFFLSRHFLIVAKGIIFAILLSMARLLPPFIVLGEFHNQFIGGYRETFTILNNLLRSLPPLSNNLMMDVSAGLTTWESTLFAGFIGTIFLIYFGFWRLVVNPESTIKVLILPSLCLAFLSLEKVYQTLRTLFPLPILTGERISSRMVSLAFVVVLVLATVEFQGWLNQVKGKNFLVLLLTILLLFAVNDLWQNFDVWSISKTAGEFPVQGFTSSMWYVANDWNDQPYLNLIYLGSAISVLSCGFILFKSIQEKKSKIGA